MSLMKGNIGFQQYKQKTKRTVKVPGNVRDTIPIHSIAEDGILRLNPGKIQDCLTGYICWKTLITP